MMSLTKVNLTEESFLEHKYIYDLEKSRDGKYLIFKLGNPDLKNNKYESNLYIYSTEDRSYKKLDLEGVDKFFVDGELMVLIERDGDTSYIKKYDLERDKIVEEFKLDIKVETMKKLTNFKYLITTRENVESSNMGEDYYVIDEMPLWKDRMGVTSKIRRRLYIYDEETSKLEAITGKNMDISSPTILDEEISYIGRTIEGYERYENGIYSYNISSKETRQILEEDEYKVREIFYLDDRLMLIASPSRNYMTIYDEEFYIYEDGNLKQITNLDETLKTAISCDVTFRKSKTSRIYGDRYYFTMTRNYNSQIYSIDIHGNLKSYGDLNGSIDGFVVDENNIYFIGTRDLKLQELYKLEEDEIHQISDFNEEYFKKYNINEIDEFIYNSNGDDITGFVIKPSNYDEDKKYPGILIIHGGPNTTYGNVYHHDMQFLSNQGYFVFYTNPHGSAGRGAAYADIKGQYGEKDYDDLMNFTDEVLERYPNIDGDRLGVTGGSYGGYMTNWIIGNTTRFKAAVSEKNISNLTTKILTTDIGWHINAEQQDATPWSNYEKLWYHSPLKYADRAKTPTLFIHGDEDYRCWIAESIQMFSALKYHDVDAKFLILRGECHGYSLSGKPSNRLKRLEMIGEWFEDFLK